jgi:hypothetical protein
MFLVRVRFLERLSFICDTSPNTLVSYIHHDEQLHADESTDKSDDKSEGSEFSNKETEMLQTEELDKCKAWGSLQTKTMEAALTSPQTKKQNPTLQ